MKVVKRICIKDLEIKADDGGIFRLKKGESYDTTEENTYPAIGPKLTEPGCVVVLSNYWVPVPLREFFCTCGEH